MSDLALSQSQPSNFNPVLQSRKGANEARQVVEDVKYALDPKYKKEVTLPNGDRVRVEDFVRKIGEPEKYVRDLGNGYYELVSKPVLPNAQWQTQILDEKALVAKFGRIPAMAIKMPEGVGEKLNVAV